MLQNGLLRVLLLNSYDICHVIIISTIYGSNALSIVTIVVVGYEVVAKRKNKGEHFMRQLYAIVIYFKEMLFNRRAWLSVGRWFVTLKSLALVKSNGVKTHTARTL